MTREDKEVLSLLHHELRKIGITDRNLRSNSISGIFHNFEMAVVKLLQECRCISYHVGEVSYRLRVLPDGCVLMLFPQSHVQSMQFHNVRASRPKRNLRYI
ncbi:hypothetical protein DY000_02018705 [Brassica cretica]|uniref:Uncharacterized protein n=1 Tax=Brassica cretica TaxID=69181 RepID=A0ABQ7D3U3_BRACR|nr:hypothetical protein DY000_02018705 [Brassica cretica]